jgi:hypothetical protein
LTQWVPSCLLKWDGHRQDFSTRNNRNFFRPGPNPARPEKCSPLVHGCTQWIGTSCARATRAARGIEDSRGSPGPAEPETSVCVTRECMGDDCSSGQAGALSLSLSALVICVNRNRSGSGQNLHFSLEAPYSLPGRCIASTRMWRVVACSS